MRSEQRDDVRSDDDNNSGCQGFLLMLMLMLRASFPVQFTYETKLQLRVCLSQASAKFFSEFSPVSRFLSQFIVVVSASARKFLLMLK